jgi:hypothetical protein
MTEYGSISDEIQKVELFLRYYVKARRVFYQGLIRDADRQAEQDVRDHDEV